METDSFREWDCFPVRRTSVRRGFERLYKTITERSHHIRGTEPRTASQRHTHRVSSQTPPNLSQPGHGGKTPEPRSCRRRANPTPPPSGAAGVSAREADKVDPDYLFFLDHVRLDGNAYAVYIPSKDGVSPPEVIRYEEPLPGSNVGPPGAGSEGGGQGGPPPLEEDSLAAPESPHPAPYGTAPRRAGVKRKAPDPSPRGEAPSGAVPMEGDPVAEPAWYDSQPDIDEDYRFFLRHVRGVNEGMPVFKMGNIKIPIGHEPSVDNSEAEEDEDAEGEDEDESIPASGQSGEDSVGTVKEESLDDEKEAGLGSDLPIVNVIDLEMKEEMSKEEDEDEGEEGVGEEDNEWKEEEEDSAMGKEVGSGSDLQIVNILESEDVKEGEKPLNAPVQGITEQEPLNREGSSSKLHPAIPHNASELQGVIWPPHIIERPDSHFKKKLMEILIKPFKQEEYDRYVAMATKREPLVKERRTRRSVVYYAWRHEMGKSYFDSYPALAEQFKLQDNNLPNRLALLRGLFFWLQNIGQEDQFRPWTDDFKGYRVVSLE